MNTNSEVYFGSGIPASFIQLQFWVVQNFAPDSPAYNQPSICTIDGKLSIDALESAINILIHRYPIFRSIFFIDDLGTLIQQAIPWEKFKVPYEELHKSPNTTADKNVIKHSIMEEIRRPFDLAADPPIRFKLLKTDEHSYSLIINAHHIVFDQITKDMFAEELAKEYSDALSGKVESNIAEITDYAVFSTRQHTWFDSDEFHNFEESWLRYLDGIEPSLNLPFALQTKEEHVLQDTNPVPVSLPAELTQLVQSFSEKENVTPFLVMLTAWSLTLARWTGQSKLCVGVPMTNRRTDEFKRTMGCFVNILPMPIDISGNPSFRECLRRVRLNILQMHRMQEMPYYNLVQLLRQKGIIGGNTLFQTGFTFESPMKLHLEGLDVKSLYLHPGGAQLDLFTTFWKEPDTIVGVIKYDEDRFNSDTIKDIRDNFLEVIESVCNCPNDNSSRVTGAILKKQKTTLSEDEIFLEHKEDADITAISATFTGEVFQEFFEFWYKKLGWHYKVRFAQFNQVFQELLNPSSLLCSNKDGNNVVMVRLDDLLNLRDENTGSSEGFVTRLSNVLDELLEAVKTSSRTMLVPLCFVLCPSSPDTESLLKQESGKLESFVEKLTAIPGVSVITHEDIIKKYPVVEYYEPYGEAIGKLPFTRPYLAALATSIIRSFHTLKIKPVKAIAVDCDRTLWEGISAEDGATEVIIDTLQRDFHKFLLNQYKSGVVLALCSKNQENDVWAVFERHPGMLLNRNHFTFWKINWESKSSNIMSLAGEINIGLDAMAFLDDSPMERAEVSTACPSVLCVEFPDAWEERVKWLEHFWLLDHGRVTAEDLKRQEHYRSEQQRDNVKKSVDSFQDFLEKLELKIEIHPADPLDYERLSQLSIRTNQFNTTTLRVTPKEVAEFSDAPECSVHIARVSDRFGDYGLVGGILVKKEETVLVVEGLFLSCRALGRGVEYRIASYLATVAKENGCSIVSFPVKTTERNEPARKFLANVSSSCEGIVEESGAVKVNAEKLEAIHYEPLRLQESEEQDKVVSEVSEAQEGLVSRDTAIYYSIASELNSAELILAEVEKKSGEQEREEGSLSKDKNIPPETKMEQIILDAWKRILKLKTVNTRLKFFEVGGTSLLMVRIAIELKNNHGIEVTVTDMFQYPTIADLAKYLNNKSETGKIAKHIEKTGVSQRKALNSKNLSASFNRLKISRKKT